MKQEESKLLDMYLDLSDDIEFLMEQADKQLSIFEVSQADKDNAIHYQLGLAIDHADKMRSALDLIVNDQC